MSDDKPFGDLADIAPPREEVKRDSTALERLLEIGDRVVEQMRGTKMRALHGYPKIYELTATDLPVFDADDLRSYIVTKGNREPDDRSMALGFYTGVLLSRWTKRMEQEGKPAVFVMDGNGIRFDWLFGYARRMGEVALTNIEGESLLFRAASYKGHADSITVTNSRGGSIGKEIAYEAGNVRRLRFENIRGNATGQEAGKWGNIGMVVFNQVHGDGTAHFAGFKGTLGTMVISQCTTGEQLEWEDSSIADHIGAEGTIGKVAYQDVLAPYQVGRGVSATGNCGLAVFEQCLADSVGTQIGNEKGDVRLLVARDIKARQKFKDASAAVFANNRPDYAVLRRQGYPIDELFECLDAMRGKSGDELMTAVERLHALELPDVRPNLYQRLNSPVVLRHAWGHRHD